MHVLPPGFHRTRHYALFAKAAVADNVARARELLGLQKPKASPPSLACAVERAAFLRDQQGSQIEGTSPLGRNTRRPSRLMMSASLLHVCAASILVLRWL
jgi:hypothetical protein